MKGACNIAFSESGKPERERAAFCNAYKKAEFLKLGEEEIKQWNEDALNAHTKAKQEWKDRKGNQTSSHCAKLLGFAEREAKMQSNIKEDCTA